MSIFGWSYPPGCSGPPEEERSIEGGDFPTECEVCKKSLLDQDTYDSMCEDCTRLAKQAIADHSSDATP